MHIVRFFTDAWKHRNQVQAFLAALADGYHAIDAAKSLAAFFKAHGESLFCRELISLVMSALLLATMCRSIIRHAKTVWSKMPKKI
jgi:hypothetical protein